MYLLDTNIISAALREPASPVGRRISASMDQDLATSVIVVAELKFGIAKRRSSRLARQIGGMLQRLNVLPLTADVADNHAEIRADLEGSGVPIGASDLLIAAHALALGATLVTDNVREFSRVDGLAVENWLRD